MTSRERIIKAMNREIPDRVPRGFQGLTPLALETFKKNAGNADPADYFKIDSRSIGYAPTRKKTDYRKYYEGRGIDMDKLVIDEFGIGHMKSDHTSWHYTHRIPPLPDNISLNDIIDYPLPDFNEPYRSEHFTGAVAAIHGRGLAAFGQMGTTFFEHSWPIRGFENFLMDMYENPDIVNCIFDRYLELRIKGMELFAKAGVDFIWTGDDVSMQSGMIISPVLWRQYLKPRMAAIIAAAKRIKPDIHIVYHSDGNPVEIYDELIEIGVTVLNPVQPECVNPAEVKLKYGNRVAFWGAFGIQHTLPFGSIADIRNEVKLRMQTIGKGGGYVIGPTHVIAPEVPWQNMKALYDAIDEFGGY